MEDVAELIDEFRIERSEFKLIVGDRSTPDVQVFCQVGLLHVMCLSELFNSIHPVISVPCRLYKTCGAF